VLTIFYEEACLTIKSNLDKLRYCEILHRLQVRARDQSINMNPSINTDKSSNIN